MKPDVYIDVNNKSVNSTDIYVATSFTLTGNDVVAVAKITEVAGVYTNIWGRNTNATPLPRRHSVNDIAHDPVTDRVFITGAFTGNIVFNATSLTTSAASDAYVWAFDGPTGNNMGNQKFNTPAGSGIAVGTSVIEGPSAINVTGYFNTATTGVFGTATQTLSGGLPGYFYSYVVNISNTLSPVYLVREIYSNTGDVKTSGIASSPGANQVIVTGTLTGSISIPTIMTTNGVYSSLGGTKTFMAGFDGGGVAAPLWANAATDNTAGSTHTSTKVAASDDACFSTGGYTNEFNYYWAPVTPSSGPLSATPVGIMNSYFVRNDLTNNGAFFKHPGNTTATQPELIINSSETQSSMMIYPNPSNGLITINLGQLNESTSPEVYDLSGKRIENIAITRNETGYTLDLSKQPRGVFILKTTVDNKVITGKISLE